MTLPASADLCRLAVSDDGKKLAFVAVNSVINPTSKRDDPADIAIYDTVANRLLGSYSSHRDDPPAEDEKASRQIQALTFTPDGNVVSATRFQWHLWSTHSFATIRSGFGNSTTPRKEIHAITAVIPVGSELITAARVDPRIADRGEILVHTLDGSRPMRTISDRAHVYDSVSVSAEGSHVAALRLPRSVIVSDVRSATEIRAVALPTDRAAVCLVPDGNRIFTAESDGSIRLWDLSRDYGRDVIHSPSIDGRTFGLATLDGGSKVIVGAGEPTDNAESGLRLWDRAAGTSILLPTPNRVGVAIDVAVSPNGREFAVAYFLGLVEVWEWKDGKPQRLRSLRVKSGLRLRRICLSGEGDVYVLAASGPAFHWDRSTPDDSPTVLLTDETLTAMALSPDCKRLAFARQTPEGETELMELQLGGGSRRPIQRNQDTISVSAMSYSPDSRQIVIAGKKNSEYFLRVLDSPSLRTRTEIAKPHIARINFVCFADRNEQFFTGSDDGLIKLWDVRFESELLTLRGHRAAVNRGVFANGSLFSSSWDATVRVWHGNSSTSP